MRCDERGAAITARWAWWIVSIAAACSSAATVAVASGSPPAARTIPLRLPADVSYELVVGADRAVVFSHETHVPLAGNRCTACHPQTFRILSPTKHLAHREMDAGASCGSCHDGRQAFGVRDSTACASCHTGRRVVAVTAGAGSPAGTKVAGRGPAPITYAGSQASPGPVTFRHATHLEKKLSCASCHPSPFAMKAAQVHATPMHEAGACGACHDGSKAFAVEDAASCARCHAERGAR
jgi:c(7)-type cytochrome triheme protein